MNRRISESGEDICPVCSEVGKIFAVGECDHPVCFKCSTRMRVLCDQMYCAICRADLPKVAFSKQYSKFGDLKLSNFKLHQKHKIFFENDTVKTCFFEIQEHRCTVCKSRKVLMTFPQLADHMKKEHSLFPCDICVKHIKLFSSERKFYDRKRLGEHRRLGDRDDKSHKGHPLCEFCDVRYLDNDELARHLRKDHYYCHFCDADGISNAFYDNYQSLRDHFYHEHFLCEEGECINAQFTNVFRFELDLKAHKATFHSKNLKRAMAKAARTLEIDFNVAPRGGNASRGRGRRDRGIVSRRDYEEVANQENVPGDQTATFGRGKDFKRERRQKLLEEEDMMRAMNASLNSATQNSVSVVHQALLNNSATPSQDITKAKTEETKYNRRSEDFPTLSGDTVSRNKDSDSETEKQTNHSDSMAKKFARANKFSVQDGGMEEEDFPSLGGTKSKAYPTSSGSNKVNKVSNNIHSGWRIIDDDFPDLGKGGGGVSVSQPVWKPPSKQTKTYSNHNIKSSQTKLTEKSRSKNSKVQLSSKHEPKHNLHSSSDYPSLSSISNSLSKGLSSGSASDALQKYAAAGINTTKQESNVQVIDTKSRSSPPLQHFIAKPPSFYSNDFPGLGNKGNDNVSKAQNENDKAVSWGPKPKHEKKPPLNVSDENPGVLKIKKKNKKKGPKQDSDSGSLIVSEDSSESLKESTKTGENAEHVLKTNNNNFEKSLSSNKNEEVKFHITHDEPPPENKSKSKKKKKKLKASKDNKPESSVESIVSSSVCDTETDKVSQKADVKSSESLQISSVTESQENKENSESEAFPSIHDTLKESMKEVSKNSDEFQISKTDEDFPVLGGIANRPSLPPPGFKKTASSAPPGFSEKVAPVSSITPPPGFSGKSSTSQKNVALSDIATLLSGTGQINNKSSTTGVPRSTTDSTEYEVMDNEVHEYIKPTGFDQRNRKLISDIFEAFGEDEDRFSVFKELSGSFRKGDIYAADYYQNCSDILGAKSFDTLFVELLVLLPDIQKQQELLTAHNLIEKKGKSSTDVVNISGKAKKGWNTSSIASKICVCHICQQVVLNVEKSGHMSEHNLDSDFPALGPTKGRGIHNRGSWGITAN